MAFATYTDLQTSIGNWLVRPDLSANFPDFITLAEAEIDRVLRRTVSRATITISQDTTPLDASVNELRNVRLVTSSPWQDTAFDVVTPEMLADVRARYSTAGRPKAAAVIAGKLVVAPAPDTVYTAEIVYYAKLVPLSSTNPSNVILTEAPDLYLYGALKHSAPFLKNDERLAMWQQLFQDALDQLAARREREEHGANMRPMKLPVVFGEAV